MSTAPAMPPSDYANALALPGPSAKGVAPAAWLMAGLLLLCLIPRTIAAWKLDTLCKDGVFYVELAEGFLRGDVEAGFGRLRLNTYPPILALLHRCGLDWEQAAEGWGVLISSLAVLPLFGWVRRQFDDRVAIAACFLYAVHPKFIEWSPEAIRDPTFWFFWNYSLYATWRAVTEVRVFWFAAAGAAITLALHTRFEGWFLYLPLAWWAGCRCWSLVEGRWKIAWGTLIALAVCPAMLLLVNVTLLHGYPKWELGNFSRLEYVTLWYQAIAKNSVSAPQAIPPRSTAVQETAASDVAQEAPPVEHQRAPAPQVERADVTMPRMSTGKTALVYLNALRRGVGALFGISWLIGFFHWRQFWFRRDHLVLFLTSICVGSGIWIHLWYAQATSSRYFLAIDVLASACAAVGWLKVCQALGWVVNRVRQGRAPARAAMAAVVLLTACAGLGEAFTNRYTGRQRDAALGRWLKEQSNSRPRLARRGSMELVDHYAGALAAQLPADQAAAARLLADWRPTFVVASRRDAPADEVESLCQAARPLGFEPVAESRLPPGFDWTDVLVMQQSLDEPGLEVASQANSKH
ncbi:MAG TPA: glycosyltransferase family 39 protein [Pirellulales bacterium]|nr:glycosyltransferase family 39 protein [Pirellulales bacterium]